ILDFRFWIEILLPISLSPHLPQWDFRFWILDFGLKFFSPSPYPPISHNGILDFGFWIEILLPISPFPHLLISRCPSRARRYKWLSYLWTVIKVLLLINISGKWLL
ncbi:MAG: hypothetical protein AAFW70_17450, partial [Cyanobacteria bacterium J06635_10]